MRSLSKRPVLALALAALCGLSVTGCAASTPVADVASANAPESRVVIIEPTGYPHLRMQAALSGRFGFVGDTCLALVSDGHQRVVSMPEGTRVEQVGDEWHVFTPGRSGAIVVGKDVVTGGGGGISDPNAHASIPAACQNAGLSQFYVTG